MMDKSVLRKMFEKRHPIQEHKIIWDGDLYVGATSELLDEFIATHFNAHFQTYREGVSDAYGKADGNNKYASELESIIEEGVKKDYAAQEIVLAVQRLNKRFWEE